MVAEPLRVAIHPAVAGDIPEITYALRTLLRISGYAYDFVWSTELDESGEVDLFYGPAEQAVPARVVIHANLNFGAAATAEPERVLQHEDVPYLEFTAREFTPAHRNDGRLVFTNDIVLASYWLLTGARERHFERDKWDNFHASNQTVVKDDLLSRPPVSLYATLLREHFESLGKRAVRPPWTSSGAGAAFSFTHDVDYPEMIRWIETLRLLRARGLKGLRSIAGVWSGTNHFWKFQDWVAFEREVGARPAFYFMARQGSLWQYARGTPDAFYDVRKPRFRELFAQLRDAGAEIGLHASFNAYRSVEQLRRERALIETVAGVEVRGGRHHYWHLDPLAPHETLLKHEQAGMQYDSSLAFEFYPGYRRGTCHPFRVFHPGERRELRITQIPPSWMDDQFDRRLERNGITNPERAARRLLDVASKTGGVVAVDYHARGMNADFYPKYGPWLRDFVRNHVRGDYAQLTPAEISDQYATYEAGLEAGSRDRLARSALHAEAIVTA